jgi:hypothetical protein
MGKHHEVRYKALNDLGQQQEYVMKICEVCANDFQKAGIKEEEFGTQIRGDETEI